MIKKSNQLTIKEAIQKLISSYRMDEKLGEVQIVNCWEKVVGEMIANHTNKLYVKKRKLFVKLDSPALKEELSYARSKIVNMLNKEVKTKVIDDIVFI
ncbi:DUF721 domain-containing protein [Bacteroidota bacterium]